MPTVKAVLRHTPNVKGEHAINLRVTINREQRYYSLKQSVAPKFWDNKRGIVKAFEGKAGFINHIIIKKLEEVNRLFYEFTIENKVLTMDAFHELYIKDKKVKTLDFASFFEDVFATQKGSLAHNTTRNYKNCRNRLIEFAPDLRLSQIDYNFLTKFESFLIKKHLSINSVQKHLTVLRTYCYIARKSGLIKENPFLEFKIKAGTSNRTFLTEDDLFNIINLELSNSGEERARSMFVFQCFTGLRFSDLVTLKWKEISEHVIRRINLKTKHQISIPLIDRAKKVLENINREEDKENVFELISNQKYNKHLHTLESKANLSKPLTSHVARHTFATLALTKGIPLEVVSSLLGHTNTKTTQIYGKIIETKRIEEMKKLNF